MKHCKRLFCLLAVLFSISLFAQTPKPRQADVAYERQTLESVFKDLERIFATRIIYQPADLKDEKEVSFSGKELSLGQILNECLKGRMLGYKTTQNAIQIYKITRAQNPAGGSLFRARVLDEMGEPLPGANIAVESEEQRTITDADGNFVLKLKNPRSVLLVSFIGMQPQRVPVTAKSKNLIIRLQQESNLIDEVVVTGYSDIGKKSFTGSFVKVSQEELLKISPTNVLQSLQVVDPSFRMMVNNEMGSDPNNVPEFYIRGRSGIGATELSVGGISESELKDNPNLPTFILDGYEVNVQQIYDLDPSRVKSVTILKDAASTAIYGSRAANGVVVVETVAPGEGKLQANYTFNAGLSMPDLSDYNLCDARQKLEVERLAGFFTDPNALPSIQLEKELRYYNKLSEIERGVNTYWLSQPLRVGFSQKHNANITGGSKNFQYGINLKLDNTAGVMKGSDRNRKALNVSLSYRLKKLQFRNQIEWNNLASAESPYGSFNTYSTRNPYDSPMDESGNYRRVLPLWSVDMFRENPLYDANLASYNESSSNQITNNFNLKWFATEAFRLEARVALTYEHSDTKRFDDPLSAQFFNQPVNQRGALSVSSSNRMNWDVNAFAAYGKSFGKSHLSTTLGFNMRETNSDRSSYRLTGFGAGSTSDQNFAANFFKPSGGSALTRLMGFFLQANYTINEIYLFDLSGRYDGASQFGDANKFAPFYSAGVGINLHNYPWMKKNAPWVNLLKVRGTYGILGNANFNQNLAKMMYDYNFTSWYVNGLGATIKVLGNPDLKWEKSTNMDVGLDLTLFKHYSMNLSYYRKITNNLIGDITIPASTGFNSYKSNLGEVLNQGYECQLRAGVVNTPDMNISLHGSLSHNSNKIRKISDGLREYNKTVEEYYKNNPSYNHSLRKFYDGASLTAIYAMQSLGINPADGREIFLTKEGRPTYQWNAGDMVVCGDTEPTLSGTFGVNFSYKGFFFFTGFNYEVGGQMENRTLYDKVEGANLNGNVDRRVLEDRWQKPGDIKGFKSLQNWKETTRSTSRFIQDNNYISFNSLSAGYQFPSSLLRKMGKYHFSSLKVQLSANDFGRISTIETERGVSYPYARTINMTLNVGF